MTMKRNLMFTLAAGALLFALPLLAQEGSNAAGGGSGKPDSTAKPKEPAPAAAAARAPGIEIQHMRPVDQRGLNMFEAPKKDTVTYTGFKLMWGGAFTQQFQGINHENTADPKLVNNVDQNQLMRIGGGFNNAVANVYMNAQLAPGIRLQMTSYLSSRHHQETWVKDGYILIDQSPIENRVLQNLMEVVTLRVGHFEVNYGDAHFRRTDNGNAMYNPLVGNLLMDAFTTEIGGEVYLRTGPWLAMAGATGGEIRGQVTVPEKRAPAFIGKLGFDQKFGTDLRVRLTGSMFSQAKANSNTLYSGDRAGSRYYQIMVNTAGTEKDSAWTGNVQPGFASEARAWVINPFIKFGALEFFGNIENAKGRARTEPENRKWTQNAYELTYRLFDDNLYVTGRYNAAEGLLRGMTDDVRVVRTQFGGGWFLTPNVLGKLEYVNQQYKNFPSTDIRNGGKFRGWMMEGVIAF
jgi:hypothetical protein